MLERVFIKELFENERSKGKIQFNGQAGTMIVNVLNSSN